MSVDKSNMLSRERSNSFILEDKSAKSPLGGTKVDRPFEQITNITPN